MASWAALAVLLVTVTPGWGSPSSTGSGLRATAPFVVAHQFGHQIGHRYTQSCAVGGYSAVPVFHPATGRLRFGDHGKAVNCPPNGSAVSGQSWIEQTFELRVGFPFRPSSSNALSIRENWTAAIESAVAYSQGRCPKMVITAPPPAPSEAYCSTEVARQVYLSSNVIDGLLGSGLERTPSQLFEASDVGWSNFTQCGPMGVSPYVCATTTGAFDDPGQSLDRVVLASPFAWNGTTDFSVWVNVSGLRVGAPYLLTVDLTINLSVFAGQLDRTAPWPAAASGYLRLDRPGTFLALDGLSVR